MIKLSHTSSVNVDAVTIYTYRALNRIVILYREILIIISSLQRCENEE